MVWNDEMVNIMRLKETKEHTINSLQSFTNTVNVVHMTMAAATKRIPVTEETLEMIKKLGHKGQTYDELLRDMAEAYRKEKFLKMLKERREEGGFEDFDEAFE